MTKPIEFPRHTKGKRPSFFSDPDLDQMLTFLVELTTEVSVLRDRLDTVEHLLDTKGTISRSDIEAFVPDGELAERRQTARRALVNRVFRMHGTRD